MKDYVRVHLRGGLMQVLLSAVLLFASAGLLAASRLDAAAGIPNPTALYVAAKVVAYGSYGIVGVASLWNIVVLAIAFTALGGKSTPPASFVMLSMIVRLAAIAGLAFCVYTKAPVPIIATAAVTLLGLLLVKKPLQRKSPAT